MNESQAFDSKFRIAPPDRRIPSEGTVTVRPEPARPLPKARECGACTACCTVLAVPSIGKPEHARCPNISPRQGCAVYETRPDGCRSYRCLWRAGVVGSQLDRPDRVGFIIDGHFEDPDVGDPVNGVPVVMVRESKFGALETAQSLKALQRFATAVVCLVVRWGHPAHQFTIFAPPGAGQAFAKRTGLRNPVIMEFRK